MNLDVSWGHAGNHFSGVWRVSGELTGGGGTSLPGMHGLGCRYQIQSLGFAVRVES